MMKSCLIAMLLLASPVFAQETDAESGLIVADGWESVRGVCLQCHSAQLITQNSGSAAVWKSRITWMQETQGLQQLDVEVEASILTYLGENYGPRQASRRTSLTAGLMPVNPYPVTN